MTNILNFQEFQYKCEDCYRKLELAHRPVRDLKIYSEFPYDTLHMVKQYWCWFWCGQYRIIVNYLYDRNEDYLLAGKDKRWLFSIEYETSEISHWTATQEVGYYAFGDEIFNECLHDLSFYTIGTGMDNRFWNLLHDDYDKKKRIIKSDEYCMSRCDYIKGFKSCGGIITCLENFEANLALVREPEYLLQGTFLHQLNEFGFDDYLMDIRFDLDPDNNNFY